MLVIVCLLTQEMGIMTLHVLEHIIMLFVVIKAYIYRAYHIWNLVGKFMDKMLRRTNESQ